MNPFRLIFWRYTSIIQKFPHVTNQKVNLYLLTEKGLALTATLLELRLWSENYMTQENPTIECTQNQERLRNDKLGLTQELITHYKRNTFYSDFFK